MTIDSIKELLRELGFPELSDRTAWTILALSDRQSRAGLLSGHSCLADGARIHDILEFVRTDVDRKVAENTRETYRKSSVRPLVEAGWIIRHGLSTNDPKTFYRLNAEFARLLDSKTSAERAALIEKLRLTGKRGKKLKGQEGDVVVRISGDRTFTLSPGSHNELEQEVVETLAPAILARPAIVYLGDTALRAGHQDRALMRQLNLPIDITESLPDVVVYSPDDRRLLIVEVVTSTGPITSARLDQLRELSKGPARLEIRIDFLTAFPTRKEFRRFVEDIAWETSVWIADEPWNLIHFVALDRSTPSPHPP